MVNKLKAILYRRKKQLPRWMIFTGDLMLCYVSFLLSYFLRFNFELSQEDWRLLFISLPIVIGVRAIFFYIYRTFAGIIRYTGMQDANRILKSLFLGSASLVVLNEINVFFGQGHYLVPISIIIIDFLGSLVLLVTARIGYKLSYDLYMKQGVARQNIIIFGAGQAGLITKRTIEEGTRQSVKVVAFLDDEASKNGKVMDGVTIYHTSALEQLAQKYHVEEVVISIQQLLPRRKQEVIEQCLSLDLKVRAIPPIDKWINGELSFNQIKNVKIEDLLGRDSIELDKALISRSLHNKKILITGAAGSIGSEMARQIMEYYPGLVILLDQAETPLYDLELELRAEPRYSRKPFVTEVASIRDHARMKWVFDSYRPDIVFHAAAYKQVPVMENNPYEALATNFFGSKLVADLAVEYEAEKMVLISSDKAVNPTNVMGASKRAAEIYVQSMNEHLLGIGNQKTSFITTRFGNVLGSNGSVIPLFQKQIAEGGPVTVTHPEITRFFMTIPEACQLVLEAGAIGNEGEIFIFDMGSPVKIVDLAKKMIKLSGLMLGRDIQISFTGLRPGEKIYEELLNDGENTIPTHFHKIMIAQVRSYPFLEVQKFATVIQECMQAGSTLDMVKCMKAFIPEYKSQNSVFETLDETAVA